MDNISIEHNIVATKTVEQLCKPLQEFGIKHFFYKKTNKHGNALYLTNNPRWTKHYFEKRLYNSCLFHSGQFENSGIYLWEHQTTNNQFLQTKCQFDIANGITFIERQDQYDEFISFAGSTKDTWLQNFFINHVAFLRKFIDYFRHHYQQQFDPSLLHIISFSEKRVAQMSNMIYLNNSAFSRAMGNLEHEQNTAQKKSQLPKNIMDKLTARERECVAYLLEGKSAKQTARVMSLSHRTIEYYFEKIKKKINAPTKLALLSIINACDDSLFYH